MNFLNLHIDLRYILIISLVAQIVILIMQCKNHQTKTFEIIINIFLIIELFPVFVKNTFGDNVSEIVTYIISCMAVIASVFNTQSSIKAQEKNISEQLENQNLNTQKQLNQNKQNDFLIYEIGKVFNLMGIVSDFKYRTYKMSKDLLSCSTSGNIKDYSDLSISKLNSISNFLGVYLTYNTKWQKNRVLFKNEEIEIANNYWKEIDIKACEIVNNQDNLSFIIKKVKKNRASYFNRNKAISKEDKKIFDDLYFETNEILKLCDKILVDLERIYDRKKTKEVEQVGGKQNQSQ